MKIKLVTGANVFEASKNAVKTLGSNNTYIIVPDRTTLEMEELVFNTLNLTASLTYNVVGLSNLASKFIKSDKTTLSEIECVLFVKKALESVKKDLKYFKADNINFCRQIYKYISQFKSSGISAKDVVCKSQKQSLRDKLSDIKLIYEKFEQMTFDRTDPSEILEEFAECFESDENLKNSDFMFLGFDSFTAKHYQVLQSIIKHANSLTISIAMSQNNNNSYIYETDIFEKVKKIAKELGAVVEVVSPACQIKGSAKVLLENLFGALAKAKKTNAVVVKEADSEKNEAEFIAKAICYQVFHGARYKDFAVACGDIKRYAPLISGEFEKNNIPYYIDVSSTALETYSALFFQKIMAFAYHRYRKNDLLFLVNSPFFDFDNSIVEKIDANFDEKAETFFKLDLGKLKSLVKDVSTDIFNGAEKVVAFLRENQEKLETLNLDAKTLSFENQIPDILDEILEAIKQAGAFTTLKEFLSALEIALQTKEVSTLPSYCDQVFIGDATDSYFGQVENLFLAGANSGILPKYETESSFLSDEDLEEAGFIYKVEPTIKMINRRNRFKLFSLLTQFNKRLFISYCISDNEGKPLGRSSLVSSIMQIFDIKDEEVVRGLINSFDKDVEKLVFALGKDRLSIEQLLVSKKAQNFEKELVEFLNFDFDKLKLERNLPDVKNLVEDIAIKPTVIEKFYDCPFKVYCENFINLTQIQRGEFSPAELGSVIHDIIADYGKKFKFAKIEAKELECFLIQQIEKYIGQRNLTDKQIIKERLTQDLKKIIANICYENDKTIFEPWMIEQKVEGNIEKKKITGRVDRVDKFKNYFRVIDYKTGRISTNILNDLKFGKKLQLFVYSKLLEQNTGLICGGVYYFDVKPGFKVSSKATKKSFLTGLKIKELEQEGLNEEGQVISRQELQQGMDEAEKLLEKGTQLIEKGLLQPYPCESSCEYCPYKAICLYDDLRGKRKGGKA